jgi:hypothetical protein
MGSGFGHWGTGANQTAWSLSYVVSIHAIYYIGKNESYHENNVWACAFCAGVDVHAVVRCKLMARAAHILASILIIQRPNLHSITG